MTREQKRKEWNGADAQNQVKLANRAGVSQVWVGTSWDRLPTRAQDAIAVEMEKDEVEMQILRGERPRTEGAK